MTPWPTSTDYNEAIQNPQVCFADGELRAGQADGLMGLPTPFSGNFADVYKVVCPTTGKNWAVKCFTRAVQGLQARYQAISEHLQERSKPFMVEFQYQEQGIKVKGEWFPVVKMSWVEGFPLNQFVADHSAEASILDRLTELWLKLAIQLRDARMAHGDLQHGNVLLVPSTKTNNALSLKLIDYDGMFVPSLADKPSGELGHRNYQHPRRKDCDAYHFEMDRFANLAIYTALRGIRVGPGLWGKYGDPENLLFRQNDFADPASSPLLRELWNLPDRDAHSLSGHLVLASLGPLSDVPLLSDIVNGGAVRPLSKHEETRVEGLLQAQPTVVRKSTFDPRSNQTPRSEGSRTSVATLPPRKTKSGLAKTETAPVPPLPSPLQPGSARRRTTLSVPPVPDSMRAVVVPPPLPMESLPPPLPALAVIAVPPPLPVVIEAQPVPPPLPATSSLAKREEAVRSPSPPFGGDGVAKWVAAVAEQFRARPGLAWGVSGAVAALFLGLLIWALSPAKRTTDSETSRPHVLPLDAINLQAGESRTVDVRIDRNKVGGTLTLRLEGKSDGVTCHPVTLLPGRNSVAMTFIVDPRVTDGDRKATLTLWADREKVHELPIRLSLHRMPRLLTPKPLQWKIGEPPVQVDFAVDRPNGNRDKLSIEVIGLPPGVRRIETPPGPPAVPPSRSASPPTFVSLTFHVEPHAAPAEGTVRLQLYANGVPVSPEQKVPYEIVRTALLPRLRLSAQAFLLARGRVTVPLTIDRQGGYDGPILLKVSKVPAGVTCDDVEVPAGEKSAELEFVTDGTAAEGAATVSVSAVVQKMEIDERNLTLILPAVPPASPPLKP